MMRTLLAPTVIRISALLIGVAAVSMGGAAPANTTSSPYLITDNATGRSASKIVRLSTDDADGVPISQKSKAFEPSSVEIRVGQAIAIINDDNTMHNAFCTSGDFKYNSGPQQPGSKSKLAFTAPGTYQVRCAIHPKMLLTVKVTE